MTFHVLREISSDNNDGQKSLTFYVMIETFAKTYSTLLVNQEYYLQSSSLQAIFQTYGAKYYATSVCTKATYYLKQYIKYQDTTVRFMGRTIGQRGTEYTLR